MKHVTIVRALNSKRRSLVVAYLLHGVTVAARVGYIKSMDNVEAGLDHFRRHNELAHRVANALIASLDGTDKADATDLLEDLFHSAEQLGLEAELDWCLEDVATKLT